MLIERRRHTDCNKIHILYKTKICCGNQHFLLYQPLQITVHDVADIIMAFVYHVYLAVLHIESDRVKSCFRLFYCQRKSYISQADNSYFNLPIFNLF